MSLTSWPSFRISRAVLCTAASFHRDERRTQLREVPQHLAALQFCASYLPAFRIDGMRLEDALCNVQSNCRTLHLRLLPAEWVDTAPTLAHRCRWAKGPPHRVCTLLHCLPLSASKV